MAYLYRHKNKGVNVGDNADTSHNILSLFLATTEKSQRLTFVLFITDFTCIGLIMHQKNFWRQGRPDHRAELVGNVSQCYEGSCWLVWLLFTRWRRRRKGYNDGCQGGDNMEYGGKYKSFTLLGATKDGCGQPSCGFCCVAEASQSL